AGLQRLAVEVMELLSVSTELGVAFKTDARLRPDGDKGLLVNTLSAYEEYYRRRALLWEIQSLTRTRPIAGDLELGNQFQQLVGALTDFRPENVARNFAAPPANIKTSPSRQKKTGPNTGATGLAAYTPDWRQAIARMRRRSEKERTPRGQA